MSCLRVAWQSALDTSVALAAAAIFGEALQPGKVELVVASMAGTVGLVVGFVLGGLRSLVSNLPRRAQGALWGALGAALGLWPALAIGAVAKLHGAHSTMAVTSLAGGVLGGALIGAFLWLGQPDNDGEARTDRPWVIALCVVVALVATVAEQVIDDVQLVLRSYPPVRTGLTLVAALVTAHAGIALGQYIRRCAPRVPALRFLLALWPPLLAGGLVIAARMTEARAGPLLSRPVAGRLFSLARMLTDFDRDGASQWFAGGDCAPFDARVNPRAREIPGNGIDDNCRFGDARPRNVETGEIPLPTTPSPVNVVLVTIDALRADHLGSYGYGRPTSPRLDEFANGARRFTHAYTSGGWTSLAVPSMITGLYARRLDWEAVAITSKDRMLPFPWEGTLDAGETWLTNLSAPVRMPSATVPRLLGRRGMRTAAVLTPKAAAIFGYRGLSNDNFEKVLTPQGDDARAVDATLSLLDSFGEAPFFVWLHLYEPHEPYDTHPGIPTFGDGLEDRYDHDVAFTDREVGRLITALDARHGRPTGLIVTADHGESFVGGLPVHGVDLHEDAIRIPLFVRGPGVSPGAVDAPASLVDLAPTVFEWTQTPAPPALDGSSLVHPDPDRTPISDVWRHDRLGHIYIDATAATGRARRLVINRLANSSSVYATGDASRPPRALAEEPDPRLVTLLGHYEEEAGTLER